jgi:hypothetical protein
MPRHYLPSKIWVVALIAAVVVIACAICLAAAGQVSPPVHARSEKTAPTCSAWATRTVHGADNLPEQRWRDLTIKALAESCTAIPDQLRQAAAKVRAVKDSSERARILANAATAILGDGCSVTEPLADSRKLASTCLLPPNLGFRLDESMLMDIRAVDYLVLNAMLRSLKTANQYDDPAERMMLNFALSAQIFGEDFRKREDRAHVHRR